LEALKEVEIDPISIIQRNVEKLKNMIHQIDQKISQLQIENYQLINRNQSESSNQTHILQLNIASEIEKVGCPRSKRWKIIENTDIESDLLYLIFFKTKK
jgi:hypothetical protein